MQKSNMDQALAAAKTGHVQQIIDGPVRYVQRYNTCSNKVCFRCLDIDSGKRIPRHGPYPVSHRLLSRAQARVHDLHRQDPRHSPLASRQRPDRLGRMVRGKSARQIPEHTSQLFSRTKAPPSTMQRGLKTPRRKTRRHRRRHKPRTKATQKHEHKPQTP